MKITAVEPIHLRLPVVEEIPDARLEEQLIFAEIEAHVNPWGV